MKSVKSPKVKEYTTFGETNSWIELLQFTLGSSLSIYNGLLWENVPEFRAEACHRDYFTLADTFLTSFWLIGRGPTIQYVATGLLGVELFGGLYLWGKECLPLY